VEVRNTDQKATPLAFVTMDSIPACQMAVQAVLSAEPGQLLAKLAPAPADVVWRNTYLPRSQRMTRSWIITIFILVLSVIWLIPVLILAGLFDLCSIRQAWPQLATFLEGHEILKALVQTGLPTLVVSLLNLAVPFLYDYLANLQGMISQGDVELSVISKNFLFMYVLNTIRPHTGVGLSVTYPHSAETIGNYDPNLTGSIFRMLTGSCRFFNLFLVLTIGGSASSFWPVLQGSVTDTTRLAYTLASKVKELGIFYTNFILLQSVGLLPFRLLEFGSVFLYPFLRITSKTPRDFAELVQPPVFQYSFYLPSAILVFILCTVYSILPAGYLVLFCGLLYFCFGYYTYKYQLLYAMDHLQHSTGGAWPMISYRIMLGMGVWQLVMAGLIALEKQFRAAILVVPLIPFTIWYSYYFSRTYEPLMKFIALQSIERDSGTNYSDEEQRPSEMVRRQSTTVDESREKGQRFINPNLVVPLEKLWIRGRVSESNGNSTPIPTLDHQDSVSSSMSLGDAHIWRNNDSNV
jgi:hypothetical protein